MGGTQLQSMTKCSMQWERYFTRAALIQLCLGEEFTLGPQVSRKLPPILETTGSYHLGGECRKTRKSEAEKSPAEADTEEVPTEGDSQEGNRE